METSVYFNGRRQMKPGVSEQEGSGKLNFSMTGYPTRTVAMIRSALMIKKKTSTRPVRTLSDSGVGTVLEHIGGTVGGFGQAPTPHSGAPKARGLTTKAWTKRSPMLSRCASSSD
jgi:hypothetical protein